MSDANIRFLGPLSPRRSPDAAARRGPSLPWAFIVVVVIPTLIAAIYLLFVASPRYVSEAQFIVRSADERPATSIGTALEGVGIGNKSVNAHAVLEYVKSSGSLDELSKSMDLRKMYAHPGTDFFSRLPRPFSDPSNETFREQFQSYLTVGYDSQTGISTLRVEAFTAEDAQRIRSSLRRR